MAGVDKATITTSTEGLEAGETKIAVKDGEMPAYRAMPAKGGPFSVVLVVQEIFGMTYYGSLTLRARPFYQKSEIFHAPHPGSSLLAAVAV